MEGVGVRAAFVTGAHGLLGSWLVKALLERDVRVAVLRRDEPAQSALALEGTEARVDVVPGDVTDAAVVQRALAEYEVDAVFHLAAQTLVGTARRSPVATFDTNVRGTWTVLEACRAVGVERVLVASSDKAYGPSDELPYREDAPLRARYPYDASKAAADLIARSYFHTYGLPVAVTRFANLYGGGDLNFSRLVPETVAAAIQGRAPVIRSDGTMERDFLYVEDAASAYLAIADALPERAAGEAFNAGGGVPLAVLDLVRAVCAAAGVDLEPVVLGEARAEIPRQYVDSAKLRDLTGWAPQVDLNEGLRRTVEWYRAHLEVLPAAPVTV
ncbi:MAG: GDP-mannose 4,6-dehydratase [Actinomycetota bacterium]|nr:GDP-mannose 4,6-dehydratase [Actinomycetota bacterium]